MAHDAGESEELPSEQEEQASPTEYHEERGTAARSYSKAWWCYLLIHK